MAKHKAGNPVSGRGMNMQRKKIGLIIASLVIVAVMAFQQSSAKKHNDKPWYGKSNNKDYGNALKTLWTKVYPNSGKSLYCGKSFSTKNRKKRKKHINAEHVFPMAWVTKDLNCGQRKKCQRKSAKFREIEADLHNIYPAQIHINRARGSYRFGEIAGEPRQFGQCDFEVNNKYRVAEPAENIRGNISRAMLYMQYQYDLTLHKKTEQLMRKWHKKYPPSGEEKRRAKIIQREQGRENPFIMRYPFKH